jgi:amidase
MTDEFWRWQACDLAQAIRTRRISSREAVMSCLARLAAVNPCINAVVDCLPEEALAAADAADRAVATAEPLRPLHGVPVTIKINVDYAGRATTNGVVAFKDRIAQADSPPVANWRKAGAIIIGRTNVPPFSARFFTDNALYGRTLNPWDAGRTPGGSSGGAAAAVATGIGALAHGNDRAGSIRYPALRRRRAAADARPRPHVRAERARRTFNHHAIDPCAGPAGALGPRSPARPRHDGGARSA